MNDDLQPAPPRYTPPRTYTKPKEVKMLTRIFGASWRTSVLGIFTGVMRAAAILVAVRPLIDGDPTTTPDWQAIMVLLGIGEVSNTSASVLAKDRAVTGIADKATSDPAKDATITTPPTVTTPLNP